MAALGQEVSSGSEERITADVLYRVRGGRIQRYSGERSGYNATVANGRCNKIIGEERCHGINQRATNIADWEECASCRATGFERNKICSLCRGVGFLFIGKI